MKELKYLNVLYISNDFTQDIVKDYIKTSAKKFFIAYNFHEVLSILDLNKIDIIYSQYDNINYFKEIRNKNKKVQIIIAVDSIKNTHLIDGIDLNLTKYLQNPVTKEDLLPALKDCIQSYDSSKSNILHLQNDYIYDYYNQVLLRNDEIVLLSKKENYFLNFLSNNVNNTVTYKQIDENIWNGSMTQDALRSVVKELRKKTYKELIKNISGIGYRFNLI